MPCERVLPPSIVLVTKVDNLEHDFLKEPYAVLQLRASASIRSPYLSTFIAAANRLIDLGLTVVLSDGPQATRLLDEFKCMTKDQSKVINFARHTTGIIDAVKLVNNASLVIAPDSSHICGKNPALSANTG